MRMFPRIKSRGRQVGAPRQWRGWLALWVQMRRRHRTPPPPPPEPAILLTTDGHGLIYWALNFSSPNEQMNIYRSEDGVTWGTHTFDGEYLSAGFRDCGSEPGYFRVCVGDDDGMPVLPYSNVVYSAGL